MSKIGQELLNAPFPEMVQKLGIGIAEAQYAMDRMSIRIAQLMSGFKEDKEGNLVPDPSSMIKLEQGGPSYSLLALGFSPTFYHFTETIIELKMSMSMSQSTEFGIAASASGGMAFWSASVSASFSQKFQFSSEGSSLMRTKLVTVPAPSVLEQRLNDLMENQINQQSQ